MSQFEEHPPPTGGRAVAVSRGTLIAVVSAAMSVVLVLAGVVVVLVLRSPSASASETTLEPVNTPQGNPFMPEPGGQDAPDVTPPSGASGSVSGSTPGLFGGSNTNACDVEQIAAFLASHPDQGSAWAEAVGVERGDIARFLDELSPMILRADTAVTNHGYEDGELTRYPAILQAGTAVLVDGYGTPRVKCYCGNPLAAPPASHHRTPSMRM